MSRPDRDEVLIKFHEIEDALLTASNTPTVDAMYQLLKEYVDDLKTTQESDIIRILADEKIIDRMAQGNSWVVNKQYLSMMQEKQVELLQEKQRENKKTAH